MLFLVLSIGNLARYTVVAAGRFITSPCTRLTPCGASIDPSWSWRSTTAASRRQLVRRVYLPSALPQIFTGLRLAFGRTLVMVNTVEIISSRDGLGSMIWVAGQTLATEKL